MIRITARWSGLPGGEAVNVFHFDGDSQPAAQAAADSVSDVLTANAAGFRTGATVRVDSLAPAVLPSDGTVLNYWPVVTAPIIGSAVEPPLPQNSCLLVKYATEGVVANRRVQGKTFLPGLTTAALDNGEVLEAFRTDFTTRFSVLINEGFGVWSRPIEGGRAGSFHQVNAVSVWKEWAQLGRRRS